MVFATAFYILAGITILSAVGVVFLKNIVHSAFLLALAFFGVAGIYVLLNAEFLAAVQLLVYGGAIAVLIAFGVMLIQRRDMSSSNPDAAWSPLGLGMAVMAMVVFIAAIVLTQFPVTNVAPEFSVEGLARLLLTDYVVAFEAAAVLLLAAMVGAIILAKGAKEA
ncbi:NADH-quinone oxidoreductase subunit J [Heliophilum fasciatum]|nr:NADH-quinone oxidoreductase subunit J [Heliophilum fasciatum]